MKNTKWTNQYVAKTAGRISMAVKPHTLIGIDPGTNTGVAISRQGKLIFVETMSIIEAIEQVKATVKSCEHNLWTYGLFIEDARLRTYFGKTGAEKWKGAGSIMRDCSIWEEEMARCKIPVTFIHPKNVKETTAQQFKQICGWEKRTSIHAREAAWMII